MGFRDLTLSLQGSHLVGPESDVLDLKITDLPDALTLESTDTRFHHAKFTQPQHRSG